MSAIVTRNLPILTDGATGAATVHLQTSGKLVGVALLLGTLVSPHIAVTDTATGLSLLAKIDNTENTVWQPLIQACDATGTPIAATYTPPVITGEITVAITAAGNSHRGNVILVVDRG